MAVPGVGFFRSINQIDIEPTNTAFSLETAYICFEEAVDPSAESNSIASKKYEVKKARMSGCPNKYR